MPASRSTQPGAKGRTGHRVAGKPMARPVADPAKPRAGRPQRLAELFAGSPRRLDARDGSAPAEPLALGLGRQTSAGASATLSGDVAVDLPLALASPDWLLHVLTVTGPADQVLAFRAAASGAGALPFHDTGLREDLLHALLAPPPSRRGISMEGARILADQLAEQVALRAARIGGHDGCAFDLHALVPVPDALLRLGPGNPRVLAWLQEHWGTTWPLRQVELLSLGEAHRLALAPGCDGSRYRFWSADWTPWAALTMMRVGWSKLRFDLQVDYSGAYSQPTRHASTRSRQSLPR